jgi:hypothetical protein
MRLEGGQQGRESWAETAKAAFAAFKNELAPQVGLEPTTLRLTAECSAIELLRSKALFSKNQPSGKQSGIILVQVRSCQLNPCGVCRSMRQRASFANSVLAMFHA